MGKLNREWNEGLLKMIMIIKRENAALETYEDFKNLNVE